jgi:Chaperone of endosialidase
MKQLRTLIIVLLGLIGFATLHAQTVPQGFNYQSVIRNADGTPAGNQTLQMLFAVRSGAANGQIVYAERQTLNSDEFGLVNHIVGQGSPLPNNDFTIINWGGGPKFLTVSVETAPNVFDEVGSTQLMSVPFALYALSSASGGGGGTGDDWGAQTVITDTSLKGSGLGGNPLGLAQQNAQAGQVLKWDGNKWTPQNDAIGNNTGTVSQIVTTNGIIGGPITTTGTIGLSNTGVIPGTYGSASQVPIITIDAQGRISSVSEVIVSPGGGSNVTLTSGAGIATTQQGSVYTITNIGDTNAADDITVTTSANGDLSGTFVNLQIRPDAVGSTEIANGAITATKLAQNSVGTNNLIDGSVTGVKLNNMGATTGQVLKWNGANWAPAADNTGGGGLVLNNGTGISITGNAPNITITNTGDTNASDDLTTASIAAGDVTGPFSNLQIAANAVGSTEVANGAISTSELANNAVTAAKLDDMGATNGQVLSWNGTTWAPVTLSGGGGGDNWGTQSAQVNATMTGNGTGASPLGLAQQGATNGQVLKWNGTTWAPAADNAAGVQFTNGPGISVSATGNNYTITNTGDTDSNDDLTNTSNAGGDVTGPFSNLQINANAVGSTEIANNAVNTSEVANGAITAAKLDDMNATNGQVLSWNGTTWTPTTLSGGGPGDNWGSQSAAVNATLAGNGTAGSPLSIAQQGATSGQVLSWNGTTWTPTTLSGGGPGDNWGSQSAAVNATLAGNGTTGSPLGIAQQGATNGQVLRWNGTAWAPATNTVSFFVAPTLTGNGTSGNPLGIAQQGATTGQVLKWNGTTWAPAADATGGGGGNNYAAGTGISITGTAPNFTINNTGDVSNTNELQNLGLNGTKLRITNGNMVSLDTILANVGGQWSTIPATNNIRNSNTGNVGIATNPATNTRLHIRSDNNQQGVRVEGPSPLITLSNSAQGYDGFIQHRTGLGLIVGTADSSNVVIQPIPANPPSLSGPAAILINGLSGGIGMSGPVDNESILAIHHKDRGLALINTATDDQWEMAVTEPDGELALFNEQFSANTPAGIFATNGQYFAGSDRRWKKDIAPTQSVLDRILKMEPVQYRFKYEQDNAPLSYGFIAQDVQKLFPELVHESAATASQEKMLHLNYAGFNVLAIKAIQEQQTQLDTLKAENQALKARLDAIEAMLNKK